MVQFCIYLSSLQSGVCVCVRACVRACARACVRACVSPAHLLKLPAAERRGVVELQRALVHREVDVAVAPLQRDMVPVLVVQEASQGRLPLGLRGRQGPPPAWSPGGGGHVSDEK
jgi:hypothetical protein